jgi:methionyl-tRNA synthetase
MVTFEDFLKLDIRIGKVIEADSHPDADKVLLLKVDIGEKQIQLVAGIKNFYNPQDLKEKYIVVLTNLEPRNIRGQVSEGMLLAAQGSNLISVLMPEKEVEAGSKVR